MKGNKLVVLALVGGVFLALVLSAAPVQAREWVFGDPEGLPEIAPEPAMMIKPAQATGGRASCGAPSSGGDGTLIKVFSGVSDRQVIYMQCGRVVAKFGTSGCDCRSGNWRYTTDCPKTAPVYVHLPCPGK